MKVLQKRSWRNQGEDLKIVVGKKIYIKQKSKNYARYTKGSIFGNKRNVIISLLNPIILSNEKWIAQYGCWEDKIIVQPNQIMDSDQHWQNFMIMKLEIK